jgi:hypothetical protein
LDYLSITIRNTHALLFKGRAFSVSSINEKGPFDVLPFHSNFISLITDKIIIVTENHESKEFKLKEKAIINVEENSIQIYSSPEEKIL